MKHAAAVFALLVLSFSAHAEGDDVPRRQKRRLGIALEGGFKNITGVGGVSLTYHARPEVSVAVGVGAGTGGATVGLRARWNILKHAFTPFIGGGLMLAEGYERGSWRDAGFDAPLLAYDIEPNLHLQAVGGLEWIASFGLTFRLEGGYSLATGPLYVSDGELTDWIRSGIVLRHGSGPLFGCAIGWTF
ncbi:MAG: hypothetical protein ACT4TC_20770 [Myxococcaceae bacterium]